MMELMKSGAYLMNGGEIVESSPGNRQRLGEKYSEDGLQSAHKNTMAYAILESHNVSGGMENLRLKFDAMASHDITYVGIIQTARASGLEKFPLPYVLTNCHNSLCAVGGTINEDDHVFGLSAAKKYGGIFVPAHLAVIHQYMREMFAGCGRMILGSDSHTRYGPLGTLAVGEGGPELVKQLLGKTYDIKMPEVVGVYLKNAPSYGVGPQDVALQLIKSVFENGFVNNKILEFVGPGIAGLSVDYRNGIDVMTTETTCLSSIWVTDGKVRDYLTLHGRAGDYKKLEPGRLAFYDRFIVLDLAEIKPSIAMPFHPSNVYTVKEVRENPGDILREVEKSAQKQMENAKVTLSLTDKVIGGKLHVDQAIIAGCAGGTFENLRAAADILKGASTGSDAFWLSVYPSSQPIFAELIKTGDVSTFVSAGVTMRTAFCGPCFGAGDVPANEGLSIRHSTRNFPNREGSSPGNNQIAGVALMDARSIAATAAKGGVLTGADELDVKYCKADYHFDAGIYAARCYNGFGKANDNVPLVLGPNIADWPKMSPLTDNLILKVASVLTDPVTTTDELIPSGETSSYRSNPLRLAEFTLSRKDPAYVGRAKAVQPAEEARLAGDDPAARLPGLDKMFSLLESRFGDVQKGTGIGTVIYAIKPGDGSAREQAASCQKVLGGWANIAHEYATKRYRSNLINWGMLPFLFDGGALPFAMDDYLFIPGIREAIEAGRYTFPAYVIKDGKLVKFTLSMSELTDDERKIILAGCLINFEGQSLKK